jgi:hypothetical protein
MAAIHLKFTRYSETRVGVVWCPTCERLRRMLCRFEVWYGWSVTCCGCGEQWEDGEQSERPFMRGWRRKNIEEARAILAGVGVQV